MSIMDELKKLTRPYDDDSALIDDDMELDDGMEEPAYTRPTAAPQPTVAAPVEPVLNMGAAPMTSAAPVAEPVRTGVSAMNIGRATDLTKYRVVLVQPENFDCATAIANNLRQGNAVVLNCESTEKDVARRVVDFLSGCAYALDGTIRKAANNVYILAPRDVGVDESKEEE